MKLMKQILPAILLAMLLVGCSSGCSSWKVAEGSDPVVVRAEQTAKLTFTVVDGYLEWEAANRAAVPAQATAVADTLRDQFPPAYTSFRSATRAYKANRTDENKANIGTWSAVVMSLMASAQQYFPQEENKAAEAKAKSLIEVPVIPQAP